MTAPDFHTRFRASLQSAANSAAASDYAEAAKKLETLAAEARAFSRIPHGANVHFIGDAPANVTFQAAKARAIREAARTVAPVVVRDKKGTHIGTAFPNALNVLGASWGPAVRT